MDASLRDCRRLPRNRKISMQPDARPIPGDAGTIRVDRALAKAILHNPAVIDRLRRLRPIVDRIRASRPNDQIEPEAVLRRLERKLVVLLSFGRSGTTVFCDFLASHPDIISLGEVLNEGTFRTFFKSPGAAERGRWPSRTRSGFYRWLEKAAKRHDGHAVIDMKFEALHLIEGNWHVPGHDFEFLEALAATRVPVILLERRDGVARFLSHEIARHHNRFHSYQDDSHRSDPVTIDLDRMERVIAANRAQMARVRALFAGRENVLDIAYEDLFTRDAEGSAHFSPAIVTRVAELIGVGAEFCLTPRLDRVSGSSAADPIANRAELEAFLATRPDIARPAAPLANALASHDGDAPDLSILVVNWNTREVTLACLRSLYARKHVTRFEVILVDNGSSDGSAEAIRAEFPQVRLIAEAVNHGFARANNIAARHARGRQILLLNSDTEVLDDAIDRIVAFSHERPEAGVWGGRTVFADGSLNYMSAWGRVTLWSTVCRATGLSWMFPGSQLFNPERIGNWQRDSEREVDIISGCFLLIGRRLWERLGGFDERFFMYGEDADLCTRACALGWRPWVTPEAVIIHHGGASTTLPVSMVRVAGAKCELARISLGRWQAWAVRWLLLAGFGTRRAVLELAALALPRLRPARARWREIWNRLPDHDWFRSLNWKR